mgnify:CR=1 FL=1
MTELRPLYPKIEPYHTGWLKVSDLHTLYYEQVGNPAGVPVVFLHGGPGVGALPIYRRYFDPQRFHVVIFSQRGAGKSTLSGDMICASAHGGKWKVRGAKDEGRGACCVLRVACCVLCAGTTVVS